MPSFQHHLMNQLGSLSRRWTSRSWREAWWKGTNKTNQTYIYINKRSFNTKKKDPPFESHLHWPIITWSPSLTRKQGDTWAGMFECLFSYLNRVHKKNNGIINYVSPRVNKDRASRYEKRIPLIFLDEVKIIPPNNNSPIHLSTVTSSS